MADQAEVKRICDEIGVSTDEAIYYLEGNNWNLASATEACRNKILPLPKPKIPPSVSLNKKSTAAESSSSLVPINSPWISNQRPRVEVPPGLKKELIDRFREVAPVVSPQEAVNILNSFKWDVQRAVNYFIDKGDSMNMSDSYSDDVDDPPAIDLSYLARLSENYIPMIEKASYLEGFSVDETSTAFFDMLEKCPQLPLYPSKSKFVDSICYSTQSQIGSSSSCLTDVDMAETEDPLRKADEKIPPMASSQVQIQESSSPAQIREQELLPPIKVDRICETIGVCREEAHYYLEGFDGDLASAMEACRSKTLPLEKVKSSPGCPVNQKPTSPEWESPQSTPGKTNSRRNLASAMEAYRSITLPSEKVKSSPVFPVNEKPASPEWELPTVPVVINPRRDSNMIRPKLLPSEQKQLLPPERKAELIKSFCDVTGASPDDAVACLNHCNWSGDKAVGYFMDKRFRNSNSHRISEGDHSSIGQSSLQWPSEGDCSTNGFSENVASEALTSLASERKAELIKSFCDVTGASPADAVDCLNRCKWNGNDAVGYFMDGNLNFLRISEGGRSMTGFSEGETSKASTSDLPLLGLPSQSQLQAPLGSSFSLMNIDPTETEESLKEASGDIVNVAITPMRSPQVDNKLKGKAVEEDSSTETFQNMITIDITFPDNTKVDIPFRSDQTVRDICNAIKALRPDDSKDYYFMSRTCEEYKDLNTTVSKLSARGTSLVQVYCD